MKPPIFLLSVLCAVTPAYGVISQYPCTNALYYARTLTGDDEFLLCQSPPDAFSILFGALRWHIPEVDVAISREDVSVTKERREDGYCDITFHAIPYRIVLHTHDGTPMNPLHHEETLTLFYQEQMLKTIGLDARTRLSFLHELETVKDSCG